VNEMKKVFEVLSKKNHRVFVLVDVIPSIGEVVREYVSPTGLNVVTVSRSRHGIVYILANGANITFGVNAPGRPKYYQVIVDKRKRKEVEERNELVESSEEVRGEPNSEISSTKKSVRDESR